MNPGLIGQLRPPALGGLARIPARAIASIPSIIAIRCTPRSPPLWRGSIARDWLDATARIPTPAVRFSSCFPFLDEIGFVPPPRTVWPPSSPPP